MQICAGVSWRNVTFLRGRSSGAWAQWPEGPPARGWGGGAASKSPGVPTPRQQPPAGFTKAWKQR